jgi:hypothetical protein
MELRDAGVASSWRTEGGIAVASSEMMELGMLAKMLSIESESSLLLLLEEEEVSSSSSSKDEELELELDEDELVSSEPEPKSLVVSMSSKMSLSSR